MAHSQYLTYEEYVELGGTSSEQAFPLLEFRARKRIDRMTFSRVQGMEEVPEAVKLCMLSLIGIDSKAGIEAQVENPVVTSFNNDGYSESYGKALSAADADAQMSASIRSMLWGETNDEGVPLLYRGCEA
jgi:hypothetical protein